MFIRSSIITVLITWGLILAVAVGIAFYRHDVSAKSLLEYFWGVSFAPIIVGFLLRGGAAKGDTVERAEGVVQSSLNRQDHIHADAQDAVVGFAFGTFVMLSGIAAFCGSFAILNFCYG